MSRLEQAHLPEVDNIHLSLPDQVGVEHHVAVAAVEMPVFLLNTQAMKREARHANGEHL